MTTTELMRLALPGGAWLTRVVDNMYPVLAKGVGSPKHTHEGLRHAVDGIGIHEVIIETPQHDLSLAMFGRNEMEAVVRTYRDRYRACQRNPHIAHIVLFKNHGVAAGTSLEHPHAQIVGTPVVSCQVRDRVRSLEEHLGLYGECLLCRMISEEIEQGARVLHLSKSFVVFIPYAALSRYHIWIFPRRHMAHFGDVTDEELPELALSLRNVLRQLHFGLGDPDYNFVVRSAPRDCVDGAFHWYVSVVPRIGLAAGFELGSGIFVNTSCPEHSAEFLRSVDTLGER